MKKLSLFPLVTLLISFAVTMPAQAQLTEDNKSLLLQEIETYLDISNLEIVDGKEINIEEKGNYYAVDIPPVYSTGMEGEKLLLGGMGINASPSKDGNIWNMTLALKKPIRAVAKDGTEIFSMDINNQFFKGVWDTRIHNFTKIDAKYADTSVNFTENDGKMLIAKTSITQDGVLGNGNKLSGPSQLKAEKITFQEKDVPVATIREVNMMTTIKDMDFEKLSAFQNNMEEMVENLEDNTNAPQESEKLTSTATNSFFSIFEGMSANFNANDITIYPPKQEDGTKPDAVEIDSARFGLRMDGLQQDKIKFGLSFGYKTQPFDNPVSAVNNIDGNLVPHEVAIDFDFLNLPAQKILEANSDLLQGSQANPMVAMMTMPQTLSEAGASFKIDKLYFAGKDYIAALQGSALASQDLPFGAVADFNAKITGLDTIMQSFKSRQTALSAMETKIMQTLTMLQLMGQKQGDNDIRTYDLKLDKTGAFTINGADLSALTGMQSGQ